MREPSRQKAVLMKSLCSRLPEVVPQGGKFSSRDAHGKQICHNVYAKTREECDEKLAAMTDKIKKEIVVEKEKWRLLLARFE